MSVVESIERAITQLTPEELREFQKWFSDHVAQLWDKQFEDDVESGKFDALNKEAIEDVRQGRSTDL